MINIEKMAYELARAVKGSGDPDYDFGNFAHFLPDEAYDDEGNGPVWNAICDRAEELLPTIKVTDKERAEWAQASRDVRAECEGERRQLGYGA